MHNYWVQVCLPLVINLKPHCGLAFSSLGVPGVGEGKLFRGGVSRSAAGPSSAIN